MMISNTSRRLFIQRAAALTAGSGLAACANPTNGPSQLAKAQVLVVGGGFGGATTAKYLRWLSDGRIGVTLVEASPQFVSCPMSNLVLEGEKQIRDLTQGYGGLEAMGVQRIQALVVALDPVGKRAQLSDGRWIGYDKLVLSPGIDFNWQAVPGLQAAHQTGQVLHAWKAGPETTALRAQLEAMPDGGVYAITIPEAPYRCPPGPYERASLVASYFKRAKPRSKVLILDANPDIVSKAGLFKKAWAEHYPGLLEYRPQHKAVAVDGAKRTLKFELQDDLQADVLNVLPPMQAGSLATAHGLATVNQRWCGVDFLNFASTAHKDIHIVGDAIQIAPLMPKSAHMASSHAKVAASQIAAELLGLPLNPAPMLTNTCYSLVSRTQAIHVASVHAYDAAERTFKTVPGSGGVSAQANELEATYAHHWAKSIWGDTLG
jgi:sulfide dehydrogenase [flavocytochrome c] flavoprotein chain